MEKIIKIASYNQIGGITAQTVVNNQNIDFSVLKNHNVKNYATKKKYTKILSVIAFICKILGYLNIKTWGVL